MQITPSTLRVLAQGFNAAFMTGLGSVQPTWQQIAMTINSTSDAENYGWMKELPGMREWIGQRVIQNLESAKATVRNKTYEHTIGVNRTDIEDDKLGIYNSRFQLQGEVVARHPDTLVWGLLPEGFSVTGFDGKPFFSAAHEGFNAKGKAAAWSNVIDGAGNPWFLADLSRTYLRPIVFQNRQAPRFVAKTDPSDDRVFMENEFVYGVDARYAAAFAFHQLMVGSKAALNEASYLEARGKLSGQYKPDGTPQPVAATHLIVGPSNEAAARRLLQAELLAGATGATETNIWRGTAQLIVSPYLV